MENKMKIFEAHSEMMILLKGPVLFQTCIIFQSLANQLCTDNLD